MILFLLVFIAFGVLGSFCMLIAIVSNYKESDEYMRELVGVLREENAVLHSKLYCNSNSSAQKDTQV